jgi:hypothetical protein
MLLVSATPASGAQLTAGQVAPAPTPRTALIRVDGPDYDGRRPVYLSPKGIAAAVIRLAMLETGEWSIAIADLSGVHPSPTGGASTGQAVLDVGIFQIGSDGRAHPSLTPSPFPTPPKTTSRTSRPAPRPPSKRVNAFITPSGNIRCANTTPGPVTAASAMTRFIGEHSFSDPPCAG